MNIRSKPIPFDHLIEVSEEARDFIKRCLTVDEEKRITI